MDDIRELNELAAEMMFCSREVDMLEWVKLKIEFLLKSGAVITKEWKLS